MQVVSEFLQIVMLSVAALFPIYNPIGNAFVVNNFLVELTEEQRKNIVKMIFVRSIILSIVGLFAGKFFLTLFGISIPVVQVAGGAIICRAGWQFLSSEETHDEGDEGNVSSSRLKKFKYDYLLKKSFYPLTFPMSVGAGALSVLFTLAANATAVSSSGLWWRVLLHYVAIIVAIGVVCLMSYIMLLKTSDIEKRMGEEGKIIINKISAFFTICVGLQILMNGLSTFLK